MADHSTFDVVGLLGPLRRYARSLTRSEAQAEDLVQDALVKAYEKQETYRQAGNLRTWLFSIVHNVFIDDWRRRDAEARRSEAQAALSIDAAVGDPESRLRLKQILDLFLALPDEQRAALHLVTVEEMSYQDAAATLGIPMGTLMSRLSRARAAIRDIEAAEQGPVRQEPEVRRAALRIVGGKDD
jgi:RNA polymerase sigma-70 factor (ECF subfamily)